MNKTSMRTLKILSYISENRHPVTLKQISKELLIPPSSAHDIITTMLEMEYLQISDQAAKTYLIGLKAFEAGISYIQDIDFVNIAKPYLKEMSEKSRATTFLAVRDRHHIVYLDKVEGGGMVRTTAQLGSSKEMYYTGLGKAILATLPTEEIETMYSGQTLIARTTNTICDLESLKKDLFEIRQRGYAIDDCEGEPSLYCIAAPIRNYGGNVIAAISIANFKEVVCKNGIKEEVRLLTKSAFGISRKLGYTGDDLYYQKQRG